MYPLLFNVDNFPSSFFKKYFLGLLLSQDTSAFLSLLSDIFLINLIIGVANVEL
jgi:hypothetical protein